VRVEVVENDVNLFGGVLGNNFVHEVQELEPSPAGVVPGGYLTSGYIESREQSGSAMPFGSSG
jgi:hypothetical protein